MTTGSTSWLRRLLLSPSRAAYNIYIYVWKKSAVVIWSRMVHLKSKRANGDVIQHLKVLSLTLAVLLVLGTTSQELNGHINPVWVSSSKDRLSVLRVPANLRLYFLDSTGALRPFHPPSTTRPSLDLFRSQETDYNAMRGSGYYNRLGNYYENRLN